MEWLAENWIWLLVGIAFIGLHLFGHGGHGGHGGQDKSNESPWNESENDQSDSHRH
ncbi:MAG: DUF2933 domain-containing protein [Marinobacter sp.]|uniref:DUF2933 domain-containing protein n=1 Tax=Marinobacter sp. TaxID=50741 RepID=UPI001B5B2C3B|nr:DUF2933 domain-containing protein [Marinobacter sp.]MBQ0745631.1 DUF2933 domain-containing protein [Marinobacter sp.]MBQ0815542.1 DUF2933 domain-containing protein [Marinobacter sp.]